MKKEGIPCLDNVFYEPHECRYVLDIMRMFCISYPADANTEFIPALCKPDSNLDPTPQTWKQHAAYQFRYTFLPECEPQGLSAVVRTTGRDSEENVLQIDVYAQKEQHEAWTWLQPLCQQIITINHTLSLKAKAYVLAENSKEQTWFSLDSVLYWKNQGVATLQGEKNLFPIESLMTLIYGKYYPDVERKLMEDTEKRVYMASTEAISQVITAGIAEQTELKLDKPFNEQIGEVLLKEWKRSNKLKEQEIAAIECQTAATQQNTIAEQWNTAVLRQNTITLQQSNDLLCAVRDGKVTFPPELIDTLATAFQQSQEPVLKNTGRKMKWCFWKDKGQILRDLLGDGANLATVAPVVAQLGKNYGPTLLEILKTLMPV